MRLGDGGYGVAVAVRSCDSKSTKEVCIPRSCLIFDSSVSRPGCAVRLPVRGEPGGAREAPTASPTAPRGCPTALLAGAGRARPGERSVWRLRRAAGAATWTTGRSEPGRDGGRRGPGSGKDDDGRPPRPRSQPPAASSQIHGEQLLLATHPQPNIEPA